MLVIFTSFCFLFLHLFNLIGLFLFIWCYWWNGFKFGPTVKWNNSVLIVCSNSKLTKDASLKLLALTWPRVTTPDIGLAWAEHHLLPFSSNERQGSLCNWPCLQWVTPEIIKRHNKISKRHNKISKSFQILGSWFQIV